MRVLGSRFLAGLCLTAASLTGGCTLSRPEGAFTPEYPEEQVLDNPDEDHEGDGDDTGDDDGPEVFEDAGVVEPTNQAYKGLVGTYLARFDEHVQNLTDLGTGIGVVKSLSRTSRFFLIRITEDGDKLISQEQMCGQLNESTCSGKCTKTSTTIFSDAAAKIPSSPKIERALEFNPQSGHLIAGGGATYLGYKGTASDHVLPTSKDDPRVWRGSEDGREGLYTDLRLTVTLLGAESTVVCQVNLVQELQLTWNMKANPGEEEGTFSLHKATGIFSTDGTESLILDAKAMPADNREDCMGKGKGSDGDTTTLSNVVKFIKTELTKCPKHSELNGLLEADAPP